MTPNDTIPDGYSRLSNGKLRAKAGRGKTPYGMTPTILARISETRKVAHRPKNQLGSDLKRFYESALVLISDGCELAREGQKDRARNTWRFITNANLTRIFENPLTQKIAAISPTQSKQFSAELYCLQRAYHPSDVPDWNIDISAKSHSLEEILKLMSRKKIRAKKNFELVETVRFGGVLRVHPISNSTPESPAPFSRRAETPAANFP